MVSIALTACAAAHNHNSAGDDAATGFYRPGVAAPASADLSRGDVPRDDYGRHARVSKSPNGKAAG